VDVSATVDRQLKAILCHRSQLQAPGPGPAWRPERLGVIPAVRERLRQLGSSSGRGYEYAARFRRLRLG
jgi:hypothetical protein